MKRANHRTVLGCLLFLPLSACSVAVDGGLELAGASGGEVIVSLAGSSPATAGEDGEGGGPPASPPDRPGVAAPASAPSVGHPLDPPDRAVRARYQDRARAPGPEPRPRSQQLLYRRLP